MRTSCSRSSHDAIASTGTPQLKLLQPFDRRCASTDHRRSRGHEDQARQQCQDEDEPLRIHGEGSGVRVETWRREGNLEGTAVSRNRWLNRAIIPLTVLWQVFSGFIVGPLFGFPTDHLRHERDTQAAFRRRVSP